MISFCQNIYTIWIIIRMQNYYMLKQRHVYVTGGRHFATIKVR